MKQSTVIFIFIFMSILMGCERKTISARLSDVDSLIMAEHYDSAFQMMASIDIKETEGPDDLAYYQFLKYQTSYLTYQTCLPDSLLDLALSYYSNGEDKIKLAKCCYYKGAQLYERKQYKDAVAYYKRAEILAGSAAQTDFEYKIAEALSFLNRDCGNLDLSLDYARKSLKLAERSGKREWMAYANYLLGIAFYDMGMNDSDMYYFDKTIPYINDVRKKDLPYFLSNLSIAYLESKPQKAKELLLESLSHKELVGAMDRLAGIYYEEGNFEEAYRLWNKALAINSSTPKDNIIHNLLEYDVERGKVDEVCQRVNDIFAIKDSIINNLKNDTIKDLQTRFDHEVAMNASNKQLIRWQWISGATGFVCLFLAIIWMHRRHKMRNLLQTRQIEISNLVSLLNSKENDVLKSESQIAKLQEEQQNKAEQLSELTTDIQELKEQKEVAESDCLELRHKIENWAGVEAEKIRVGAMLIEKVNQNVPVRHWPNEDLESCIDYYCAVHREFSSRMSRSYRNLTLKDKMYLILDNMGKDKKDISIILGIDERSVRSNKFRISKKAI